ncbi:TPA: autolysin [Neisseria gonorrhoeae]
MRNATSYGGNGVMWRGISSGRHVRGNYVLKASTAHNQAELERYVHNPQVRAFLDFIAASEGVKHGYQTAIGNYRITDFSRHPGNSVRRSFTRTDGSRSTSDASGRYQFMGYTWKGLAKQYSFTDFSPATQDKAAVALILAKKVQWKLF